MWGQDNKEKKEYKKREVVKPLPQEPKPQIKLTDADLMSTEEVFRHSFINSEDIRQAHGFTMKKGRLEMVHDKWTSTTSDTEKVEWVRKIFKEVNGKLNK